MVNKDRSILSKKGEDDDGDFVCFQLLWLNKLNDSRVKS